MCYKFHYKNGKNTKDSFAEKSVECERLLWSMSCSLVIDDSSMHATTSVEQKAVSWRGGNQIFSYTLDKNIST